MSDSLVGQRRSFDGQLCTIRYVGSVQGTTGDWLGVEWDDPTRGKHAGEHKGVRYFTCQSTYPTAGSFVRPSRPSELPRSFLEGLRAKYASESEQELVKESLTGNIPPKTAIEISGKVVEEVGFDKIRKQLAELQELRIVLLDGLRISGVLSSYDQPEDEVSRLAPEIASTCPKVMELDLSRSLLTRWRDIWQICNQLKKLKKLRLNGNRLHALEDSLVFEAITELHLEETLLSWEEIVTVASRFPSLTSLTASGNQLSTLSRPLTSSITKLTLENNEITSLSAIRHLARMPNLEHISLRGNNITSINDDKDTKPDFYFPHTVCSLDLSRNNISSWAFLNDLSSMFPSLSTLRISGNPLYDLSPLPPSVAAATSTMGASKPMTVDEAFMLTLSRFPPSLRMLNFSTISVQDRSNAEMYYLSLIGKELSATAETEEPEILAAHPRYNELCDQYGAPTITRAIVGDGSGGRTIHPRSVAARLVKMAFRLQGQSGGSDMQVQLKEIPTSFDSYQVKALVSRLFGLEPYSFKLIWETDEFDPVETTTLDDGKADWDEDSEDEMHAFDRASASADTSRFVRREIELVDSTRDIGFLFQGELGEVKIRVEMSV
ncbi:hypothetical protein N7532_008141 [Penicillium argentinense]|uniref:CAP-Gly domain-containing protein n=1 Tax=Penicillium argentinense TaxID=1131581 RepID=A0A9W9EWU7_9EURO|nr:uncharacterized protein N7532_008141 [Penicillium argentinense]KAJ5089457.1 hypothetical protein N7532_008141 [Penicillium argentinense]